MKVLAIVGTNRRNGLVERLCQSVLKGAEEKGHETEMINLYDYDIKACVGCWACASKGKCFLEDDFGRVYEKVEEADVILIGAPCFWGNVPGIVKTFFDRHTGYAMWMPENAPAFAQMKTSEKAKKIVKALKSFGGLPDVAGKTFWLIAAMTYPLPKALLSGDYGVFVHSVKIYAKKLKCKSFHKLVFTDSLFRFLKNKEERYLKKARRIGRAL